MCLRNGLAGDQRDLPVRESPMTDVPTVQWGATGDCEGEEWRDPTFILTVSFY